MDAWLHIGLEKTGTTALQDFLDRHREDLARRGVVFPRGAGVRSHRRLCIAAYDPGRRDNGTRHFGIRDEGDLEALRRAVAEDLRGELRGMRGARVIFSSEHFQSRLRSRSELERLGSLLRDLGAETIRVVVYLRRPADLVASLLSTTVKAGRSEAEPPGPEGEWHWLCDHRGTLERWSEVFGAEHVVPRIFERAALREGSIVPDFLHVAGVVRDAGWAVPGDANPRLAATAMELLRRVNARVPAWCGDRPNPRRQRLVPFFEAMEGERFALPPERAAEYERAFRESDEWVRRRFFPEREALFQEAPAAGRAGPPLPAAELDRIAGLVASLWTEQGRRIETLERKLERERARRRRSPLGAVRRLAGRLRNRV